MRLSHRTTTARPKFFSDSSHSQVCYCHINPFAKHPKLVHFVYDPQHNDVNTQEHYRSRRDALLSAVVLGAAAHDSQQPAAAHIQQQPHWQLDELQQRQHQRELMHSVTGRRPIVVTLADIQADYDRYASSYDDLDDGAASQALGFPKLRRQLLQQAHGNVLEIAVGTGLNLSLYQWSKLRSWTGVDLSEGMLQEAAVRVQGIPAALAEMVRVLKPGGQLLLLEHSRSDNPVLGAYQGVTRSAVTALSKGCDWGQDVPALLAQLPQLQVVHLQRHLAGTLVMMAADKQQMA
eukprot:gene2806-3099_t